MRTTPPRVDSKPIQRDEGIVGQGMRAANLRPLRENKMDFSSPSRGELTPGRRYVLCMIGLLFIERASPVYLLTFSCAALYSLIDKKAQEEFRAHLEERVRRVLQARALNI